MRRMVVYTTLVAFWVLLLVGCGQEQPPGAASNGQQGSAGSEQVTETDKELPELISLAAFGEGSSGYIIGEGIIRAIEKGTGVKTRQIPSGTDPGRIDPVRKQDVHLAMLTATSLYMANTGLEDFAVSEWGPQPFRGVWTGGDGYYGVFTRADSDIYTAADLKGKRLPIVPGSPFVDQPIKAYMAYAGLDPINDATWVTYSSYSDEMRGVLEGALDAGYADTTASTLYDLEASFGIRWVSLEPIDEDRWAQTIGRICPHYSKPTKVTRGAGLSEDNPVTMFGGPYAIITYPWLTENVAYAITKAIWENPDVYQGVSEAAASWTHEAALDLEKRQFYPVHPGSKKFFQEIGVWTDELEKWDQHTKATEEKRQAAWKKALEDGKVGQPGWKDEWKEIVVDIEFNTP